MAPETGRRAGPPPPNVSTDATERFMHSVKDVDMSKVTLLEVHIVYGKRKKGFTKWIGPDTPTHVTRDGRVVGKERAFLTEYLLRTTQNRCSLRFPGVCIMGDRPFENPSSADFDHADGDRGNNLAGNFRFTCPPCNKHVTALQWKRIRAVASSHREREMQARPHLEEVSITSRAEKVSVESFPGAVRVLFCKDGYLEKPGQHRPKKWLIGILPEKVGKGRSTTHRKYIEEEFIPQGYLTEEDFTTEKGKETHLVRTDKDATALIERELGRNISAFRPVRDSAKPDTERQDSALPRSPQNGIRR